MTPTGRLSAIAVVLFAAMAEARQGDRWDDRVWDAPPEQTMGQVEMGLGWSPKPTTAPIPRREIGGLEKRITDNNPDTCGYIDGIATLSLFCDPGNVCVNNPFNSIIACCPEDNINCDVFTTCLGAAESDQFTTDNGFTMFCGLDEFPACYTYLYYDQTYAGYTVLGCGAVPGTASVYYLPTALAITEDDGPTRSTSEFVFPTGSGSGSNNGGGDAGEDSGDNTNDSGREGSNGGDPSPEPEKKSNIPAIVGGAVGGVAALALLGLAIFCIKKRGKKNKGNNNNPPGPISGFAEKPNNIPTPPPPTMVNNNMAVASTTYPPQSPMQHQQQLLPQQQQQQQQQQPGMMMMNNGTATAYPPTNSPPPPNSHIPSMYSASGPEYGQQQQQQQQQQNPPTYPHGAVQSQYGQPPVGGTQYPTPPSVYLPLAQPPPQQQQHQQQQAGQTGYGAGWVQPPAITPPPPFAGHQVPPTSQPGGFVAELSTEKTPVEPRELA